MRRRLWRVALVAPAVALVGIGGWVAPAGAADPPLTGSISVSPSPDGRGLLGGGLPSSNPTVTGHFDIANLDQIDGVALSVKPTGPQGASVVTAEGCDHLTGGGCKTRSVQFAWPVGSLAYNGPYQAVATARGSGASLDLACVAGCNVTAEPVSFKVAVAPPAPTGVVATFGTGAIDIGWDRNNQPDTVGYVVERKGPTDGAYVPIGAGVAQPGGGRVSYTDPSLTQGGGAYAYEIVAVRAGGDGDMKNAKAWVQSKPSAAGSATVPGPPAAAAGPVPGFIIPPGGRLDLGSLGGLKGGSSISSGPPDTGFRQQLPYSDVPTTTADPGADESQNLAAPPNQAPVPVVGHPATAGGNRAVLIPIAGGAVLFVTALHLRWFSRRLGKSGSSAAGPPTELLEPW